jgi:hypothetical protein
VHRCDRDGREVGVHDLATPAGDLKCPAQQCLRRGSAKENDDTRFYRGDFAGEPWFACGDFSRGGPFVKATFSGALELEVLDNICDVGGVPGNVRGGERFVEHPPCGSHEWLAREILIVSRLFSDEHHRRVRSPKSENGLRCGLVQRTPPARLHGAAHRGKRSPRRHEFLCAGIHLAFVRHENVVTDG